AVPGVAVVISSDGLVPSPSMPRRAMVPLRTTSRGRGITVRPSQDSSQSRRVSYGGAGSCRGAGRTEASTKKLLLTRDLQPREDGPCSGRGRRHAGGRGGGGAGG